MYLKESIGMMYGFAKSNEDNVNNKHTFICGDQYPLIPHQQKPKYKAIVGPLNTDFTIAH